jgi:hypothetical protein
MGADGTTQSLHWYSLETKMTTYLVYSECLSINDHIRIPYQFSFEYIMARATRLAFMFSHDARRQIGADYSSLFTRPM